MQVKIFPSNINGEISAPPSKSFMQRAVAAGLLAEGKTVILNPAFCNDTIAAIKVAENLGADIEKFADKIEVFGGRKLKNNILNCGESGLCIRMFSSIAATFSEKISLIAEGSLLMRPVEMFENSLQKLGVECSTNNGFPPINVKGNIKGGFVEIDGSVSSQFLTGLLFALPLAENDSVIYVKNLKSKPYIDMTISILKKFGVEIENQDYKIFRIPGNQKYKSCRINIEGDWSSAAFLLVAGALGGNIEVSSLEVNSNQADKSIIDALLKCGAKVNFSDNSVFVEKNNLKCFDFDATDCPDLFPPLVSLAVNCEGISSVKGISRLIYKESNRAIVLKSEFKKIGIEIELIDDVMKIHGSDISGGTVNSNNDHRIAMSLSVAAINSKNPVVIENAECVAKSYPAFFDDFKTLGANFNI